MKQLLLPFLFLLGFAFPAYGQQPQSITCSTSTTGQEEQTNTTDVCEDCRNTPLQNRQNGSLNGKLVHNSRGSVAVTAYVDFLCDENVPPTTIGDLNVSVGQNDTLVFDPDIVAFNTAVEFGVNGSSAKSAVIIYGPNQQKFYNDGRAPTFTNLQEAVRAAAESLPVTLMSWEAKAAGSDVDLTWSTLTEEDNDFFSVEHSADGQLFVEVATVSGNGSTMELQDYTYTDVNPGSGTHYYRLVQQDYDGTRTTYDVVSVTLGEGGSALARLFPNPARAGERVTVSAGANVTELSLHSITGRLVKRYAATGGIDLPADLASGVYLLRAGDTTTRLLVR